MGENPEEQDKMADTLKTDILVERQDKRRLSSGSSTQSKGGARKRQKWDRWMKKSQKRMNMKIRNLKTPSRKLQTGQRE